MKNHWLKKADDEDKLRDIVDKFDQPHLPWMKAPCNYLCWFGGRFPSDGQWFPTGRRIDPCVVCGSISVTYLNQDRAWGFNELWLCEKHERTYYKLWNEFWKKDYEFKKSDPEGHKKVREEMENIRNSKI